MLGIEVLFQVGDKILKVDSIITIGVLEALANVELQQAWQLDNSYEQTFSPLPIVFQDLIPVIKGKQSYLIR
jgi:hypothetical protein